MERPKATEVRPTAGRQAGDVTLVITEGTFQAKERPLLRAPTAEGRSFTPSSFQCPAEQGVPAQGSPGAVCGGGVCGR